MTQEAPAAVSAILRQKVQRFPALANPAFRLFWLSMFASFLGNQMQLVAQGWLVLELTNSALFLGVIGAASGLPVILLSPFGGALADRLERRRLIIICLLATSGLMIGIALLVLTGHVAVWQVMGVAICLGVIMAFNDPARQAFVTELVEKKDFLNAVSLNATAMNITRIGGPVVAGALIAAVGTGFTYLANTALSFAAAATMLTVPKSKVGVEARKTSVWSNMREGISYVRGSRTIKWLLVYVAIPAFPGSFSIVLLPVFARDVLDVGAAGLGQMMGAMGFGALVGSVIMASLGNIRHKGLVAVCGGMGHCSTAVIFSFSTSFPLSLTMLALGGMATAIWLAGITTLFQIHTPSELRGRVMSLYLMTMQSTLLGQVVGGVIASRIGAPLTVALGCSSAFLLQLLLVVISPVIRKLD